MPQYAQNAIAQDLKVRYNKDFSFQVAGSVKALNRQLSSLDEKNANAGNVHRMTSTDANRSSGVLSMEAAHELNRQKSSVKNAKDLLTVRFRVFDHDVDDDDDFMGSHKARIQMSANTAEYHKQLNVVDLVYDGHEKGSVGSIEYRIFLNAVQIYQDHELHYIDMGAPAAGQSDGSEPHIYDAKPQSIGMDAA